jgi:hypothetical protein
MTIYWKALEEHFLMVPELHFLNFSKNLSPNSVCRRGNLI